MTAVAQKLSDSMEDYLEAIFLLIRDKTVARSKDIAEKMQVNRSSVTGALQALRERGLVNYEPYGFVTLTVDGAELAKRVLRRHVALREFMVTVLAIDEEEADEAACRMEHGVSKHIIDRFVDFAEFIKVCPSAGSKWVNGLGYQCKNGANSTEKCVKCIRECLDGVKARGNKKKNS